MRKDRPIGMVAKRATLASLGHRQSINDLIVAKRFSSYADHFIRFAFSNPLLSSPNSSHRSQKNFWACSRC